MRRRPRGYTDEDFGCFVMIIVVFLVIWVLIVAVESGDRQHREALNRLAEEQRHQQVADEAAGITRGWEVIEVHTLYRAKITGSDENLPEEPILDGSKLVGIEPYLLVWFQRYSDIAQRGSQEFPITEVIRVGDDYIRQKEVFIPEYKFKAENETSPHKGAFCFPNSVRAEKGFA